LDPTGTVPVAPLGELVNPFNPNKVSFDVTDSEDESNNYTVTNNALQDFTDASSNVHKELEEVTFSGTLVSSIDLGPLGSVGTGGVPGFGGSLRADLLRYANLKALADAREPILVVSPRISKPRMLITFLGRSWSPDLGENTLVTITVREARIVNPLDLQPSVPDVANSFTGNNSAASVGTQAPAPVTTQLQVPPSSFGLPPTIIPVA
jgi:hypothetical protein